jgi:tetratricopeptide (TPR) repeat protein
MNPMEINDFIHNIRNQAIALFEERQYYQILDLLDMGIKVDPYNHVLHYDKAHVLTKLDCLLAALQSLETCLKISPNYELAQDALNVIEYKLSKRYTMDPYS